MTAINPVTDFEIEDGIAIITVDSPPVNALGHQVRLGIAGGLDRAFADEAIVAVVLICGGRTFFAGADINEFGKPLASPVLREIAQQMEGAVKPVVAAIHGTALGGGLETALACHWRIAVPSAKLGLPEVKLGLLAGAGGTQRLPRLVGAGKALDMVVSGDPIDAVEAYDLGLIDALSEQDLRADAVRFAREVAQGSQPLRRVRDMPPPQVQESLFADFRNLHTERLKGFEAPEASIRCIEAAVVEDFDEGMKIERRLFEDLMPGVQCAAQRYLFFAEREAAKVSGLGKDTRLLPREVVGVRADMTIALELARRLRMAGIEPSSPISGCLELDLMPVGAVGREVGGSNPENVATVRFIPTMEAPTALEILRRPEMTDSALATALAIAKRLGLACIVTLTGGNFIGQRMSERLASAVDHCVGDGLPKADLVATADAFGISIDSRGDMPPGGRPLEGDAAQAVIERLVVPLVNEGARMLEEGAAARASDIDIACVKAGMFKAYRGGPMFQASQVGLYRVIDTLIEHQQRWGDAHGPSPLLERVALHGGALHETKGAIHG